MHLRYAPYQVVHEVRRHRASLKTHRQEMRRTTTIVSEGLTNCSEMTLKNSNAGTFLDFSKFRRSLHSYLKPASLQLAHLA